MSSFKKLSKADVTVVPYHANKQWNFSFNCYNTLSNDIKIYRGTNVSGSFSLNTDPINNNQYERLVYDEINHMFYQSYTDLLNTSSLANSLYYESASQQRPTSSYFVYNSNNNFISNFPTGANEHIRVVAVNQNIYGNKILPNSFAISSSEYYLKDDGYGNIYDVGQYIDDGYIDYNYFLTATKVGNIFYPQGLIVITNQDYQEIFPIFPYASNDFYEFDIFTTPKTIYPLLNDNSNGGIILTSSIQLSGSNSSYFTNVGDGTLIFNVSESGFYDTYYTYNTYKSGSSCILTSNKAYIGVTIKPTPPPATINWHLDEYLETNVSFLDANIKIQTPGGETVFLDEVFSGSGSIEIPANTTIITIPYSFNSSEGNVSVWGPYVSASMDAKIYMPSGSLISQFTGSIWKEGGTIDGVTSPTVLLQSGQIYDIYVRTYNPI